MRLILALTAAMLVNTAAPAFVSATAEAKCFNCIDDDRDYYYDDDVSSDRDRWDWERHHDRRSSNNGNAANLAVGIGIGVLGTLAVQELAKPRESSRAEPVGNPGLITTVGCFRGDKIPGKPGWNYGHCDNVPGKIGPNNQFIPE